MTKLVKIESTQQIPNVLKELETAFFDIPFENSDFQNRMFVVADQLTPGRAYRAVGLRMFAKIRAVKEYMFGVEEQQIEMDEIDYKLTLPTTDTFEKRRLELRRKKALDARSWTDKLLNDALRELDCLYGEFVKLPKFNREQFEMEEQLHFEQRLTKQISCGDGAKSALLNFQNDYRQLEKMTAQASLLIKDGTRDDATD